MSLTREQLLAAATDLPTAEVEIAEWGGIVRFRALDLGQKLKVQDEVRRALAIEDLAALERMQVTVIAITMIDETGAAMFCTDADAATVNRFKPEGFRAAWECVRKLNGLGGADAEGEEGPLSDSGATA